jgi:hypothetical protein
MKNLASLFNKPVRKFGSVRRSAWPLPDQMIGLELEAEGKDGAYLPAKETLSYWDTKKDGSLLHGVVYILIRPLRGDELAGALDEIFQKPAKFKRFMTGSTHIHLDMTEKDTSAEVVKSIVFMMYCLESVIFQITDPAREYCGYTNKLISAPETLIGAILSAAEEDGFAYLKQLCNDNYNIGRYYGLNVMALSRFGSLEFRYFPTATTQDELESWIRLVMQVKIAATENALTELINVFNSEDRYERFINTYFAEWRDAFLQYMPAYMVRERAKKAIAAAQSCTSKEVREFNPKAVTESSYLKHFVKKELEVVEPYPWITVTPPGRAPNSNSLPTTVLFNVGKGEAACNIDAEEFGWYALHMQTGPKTNQIHWKRVKLTLETILTKEGDPTIHPVIFRLCRDYLGAVNANLNKGLMKKLVVGKRNDPVNFVIREPVERKKVINEVLDPAGPQTGPRIRTAATGAWDLPTIGNNIRAQEEMRRMEQVLRQLDVTILPTPTNQEEGEF